MATSLNSRTGTNAKAVIDDVLVLRVTMWSVTLSPGATVWGDSDSEGFTNRALGRRDATGSLTGKFDTTRKIYTMFDDGDIVQLALWETGADYWAFPRVLLTNFAISYNQDTKEVVEWSTDFGSDGPWYRPGGEGAPSYTLPSS